MNLKIMKTVKNIPDKDRMIGSKIHNIKSQFML